MDGPCWIRKCFHLQGPMGTRQGGMAAWPLWPTKNWHSLLFLVQHGAQNLVNLFQIPNKSISADPSPPSSRGRRLGRTKQMALALTFCLVARNSHVSAATIRHRAFSGVEGLSTPGALLFRMGCPAPIPLHSPCF